MAKTKEVFYLVNLNNKLNQLESFVPNNLSDEVKLLSEIAKLSILN